jgi:hypothetical protein
MTPAWLLAAVAALMLAVAAVSAARLLAARPWRRGAVITDTDVAHPLMAVAMAGMLAPGLRTLPDTAWEVIFGLLAAWFAVRVARDARVNGVRALAGGHCAPHLAHSCAMVYMFLAIQATADGTAGMEGMSGMPGDAGAAMSLRYPTLALIFAFILVGYSIWDLDRLSGRRYSLATARVSLAGATTPRGSGPGLHVLAGTELGSAALPGPVALRDSGHQPGPDDGATVGAGERAGGEVSFLLSPAVTVGCRVAMGVAMAFMLFIAI